MSFWRGLNKTFNNVVGGVGSAVAGLGIPVVSQVGGIASNIIQAGKSQGGLPPMLVSGGGYPDIQVGQPQKDNTMLYVLGGLALLMFMKK